MTCGLAIAVTLLLSDPNVALAAAQPPAAPDAPVSVASEPMFAEIITMSASLRDIVDQQLSTGATEQDGYLQSASFGDLRTGTAQLAERDMQGHLILKERGTDGDLKCILRGIAEDMPRRIEAIEGAADAASRRQALSELRYLLNDNVEVITAPPQPEV